MAPWAADILLLRFFRTRPLWRAALLLWPTSSLVVILSQWGFIPAPAPFAAVLRIIAGLIGLLPYLIDRWAGPQIPAALRTLVFPLAGVSLGYAMSFAITGTIRSAANTQFSVGPPMQVAAVAGIMPITFPGAPAWRRCAASSTAPPLVRAVA